MLDDETLSCPPPAPAKRVCVLLLQLGGPETLDDIEPFLRNLFEDVLPAPKLLRKPLSRIIAKRRSPKVSPNYAEIGGGSPLLKNTQAQAAALEQRLRQEGFEARVLICMRYAPPRAQETIEEARRNWNDTTWVALPLYPQYSYATTRSSLDELHHILTEAENATLVQVNAYPAATKYIASMVDCVQAGLDGFDSGQRNSLHILFSAHGLPMKLIREGDPYPEHVQQSVDGIMHKIGSRWPHHLSYQSRVGPVKWLEPSTQAMVKKLGAEGVKNLLVVPISFVSEHIETLHELDIELLETAKHAGITNYQRAPTPGIRPSFIDCLVEQVLGALPKPKPRPIGSERSGSVSQRLA